MDSSKSYVWKVKLIDSSEAPNGVELQRRVDYF